MARVAGPFNAPPITSLHISSFGVVPKKSQIVDLSSPSRTSVNDGITPDDFTLHYVTIDHIIPMVSRFASALYWPSLT